MLVRSIDEPRIGSANPAKLRRPAFCLTDALEHGFDPRGAGIGAKPR